MKRVSKAANAEEIAAALNDGWCLIIVRGYYHLIKQHESRYANANSVRSVMKRNPDKWKIDCWTNGPNFK